MFCTCLHIVITSAIIVNMGRIIVWATAALAFLLVRNTHVDCIILSSDSSTEVETQDRNETNTVGSLLQKLVNETKSLFDSAKNDFSDFGPDVHNITTADIVKPLDKVLLNKTSEDLRFLTKNLANAVENYLNSTNNTGNVLSDSISDLFKRLSLFEPDLFRTEANRIINDEGPPAEPPTSVADINVLNDSKLLNDVLDLLNKLPQDKNDLEEFVKMIFDSLVSNDSNRPSDELQEILIKTIGSVLQLGDPIYIDGESFIDHIKNDAENFIGAEVKNFVDEATKRAIDNIFDVIEGNLDEQKLNNAINIDRNIEISINI